MGVIWMELEAPMEAPMEAVVVGKVEGKVGDSCGCGRCCVGSDSSIDLLKGLRARNDDKRRKKYAVVGDNVRNNVSVRREVVEDDGIMTFVCIAKD
mmetsp:Transcript_14214/g.26092  ORF Transcript_14214/g.26092 Transcript_14214/m.26092 type:complete len:96 (-) Transcript_14214:95-382(-)